MFKELLKNGDFLELSSNNIKNILEFLLENRVHFGIVANLKEIEFNPILPKHIVDKLSIFSLFSLSGYTFESAFLDKNELSFEAGFGEENFGSHLKVPYNSILQVIVEENIIAINLTATIQKESKNKKKNSFEVFKSNPKNKKFL